LSPPRHHWIVVITHITVAQSLLVAEQVMPEAVRQTYKSINERYIDLISTYVVTICFIFFMIRYLRSNYIREHKLAVQRLKSIEKKNRELEQINQEKNRIFSIIAHDLRSPIDSIQSYLELINMQALREEEKEMFNRSLLDLTQHTSDMLANMLLWANTQMNGASVHLRETYLMESVRDILDMGKAIAAKKGIMLEYTIDAQQMVITDTDMLGVVLRNLVNNAIKFTHPGGKIRVAATSDRDICTLSVSDTGIGIDPEKMEHLFTLKGEASFGTQNEKGVGLGLILCKEYIEMQGGTIRVSSSGAGTTFYVTLTIPAGQGREL
jgi:two-component system sensor histidine kinase/response regulator